VHVLTRALDVTDDRNEAEENMNAAVVALSCIHRAAGLAQRGEYLEARMQLIITQRLLQRAMTKEEHQQVYMGFVVQAEKLDQFMRELQHVEKMMGAAGGSKRDDDASKAMYQMKRVSVRQLMAGPRSQV